MNEVTALLQAWKNGNPNALANLLEIMMPELHRRAAHLMSLERQGHTLQPTALINELALHLLESDRSFENRLHFFLAAAEAMRRTLVNHARAKNRQKRGGEFHRVSADAIDRIVTESWDDPADLLAIDEALDRLNNLDPDAAQLVTLRYFSGHSMDEVAEILSVSKRTAERRWEYARTVLFRLLNDDDNRDVDGFSYE